MPGATVEPSVEDRATPIAVLTAEHDDLDTTRSMWWADSASRVGTFPGALGAGTVALVLVVGCSSLLGRGYAIGAGGIRTFAWHSGAMCDASAAVDPVMRRLEAGPEAREPVVLVTPDGRRVSVVWPEGFSLEVGPPLVLRSQTGAEVAREGHAGVVLAQRHMGDAAGTWDDPYLASGLVFGDCHARLR